MDRYVDLVAVVHGEGGRPFLFEAPAYSVQIEVGSYVICDTKYGKQYGEVIDRRPSVLEGSGEYNFAVALAEATLPLKKVLGYIKPIQYEEERSDD